ncbi:MAG: four helix bundle protein [Lacunisphaera sp.]|nr:four helix bundle protein [Lacunisphaera sp.]
MDLFVEIHRLTANFPPGERYLVAQIRSAALSAPSNIAEGAADQSRDQFLIFLGYAIRSLNEVEHSRKLRVASGWWSMSRPLEPRACWMSAFASPMA